MRLKGFRTFVLLSCFLVITSFLLYKENVQAKERLIFPDKKIVDNQVHSKKIKDIAKKSKGEDGNLTVRQYVSGLDLKGILEAAEDFSKIGEIDEAAFILSPTLKEHYKQGIPYKEIYEIILNNQYNEIFRMYLIDSIAQTGEPQELLSDDFVKTMLNLGNDETEDEKLRRYALLYIRKPDAFKGEPQTKDGDSVLFQIFNNGANPPTVRGSALTAMRRTNDPVLKSAINMVLESPNTYDEQILRYAMVTASKSGLTKNKIATLKKIAETVKSQKVYGSAVYAIGISGGSEAVNAILSVCDRYNDPISKAELLRNYKAILAMLDQNNSEETLKNGIKAAQFIKLNRAIELLEKIKYSKHSQKVKDQASDAIKEIKTNQGLDINQKREVR